jgi:hypothetical protein
VTRLRKTDAEALLERYDADPIAALTAALRVALDAPELSWPELLAVAALDERRRQELLAGDQRALDRLAAELNETRVMFGNGSAAPA